MTAFNLKFSGGLSSVFRSFLHSKTMLVWLRTFARQK